MLTPDKFEAYLEQRWRAFMEGEGNVDCQACRGCCRAGYAIGLSEEEAARIPHNVVAGENVILPLPDGRCPYLVDEACSIYAERPVSCRQFDCRDFAMASLRINDDGVAGTAEINRSIERFYAENGQLSPTRMAECAAELLGQQNNAVRAAQGALVDTLMHYLPRERARALMRKLTGPDEMARGRAMRAVEELRGQSA